jgi:glycine cleavage system H lipoate-binding protein
MITGYPTIKTAVQALRLGAVDYLAKPFTRVELMGPVNRALRRLGRPAESAEPPAEQSPEGPEPPELALLPGDRFRLREHSWAVFRQDGTMEIGIERAFLEASGRAIAVELPTQNDLVEQGFVTFRLKTAEGEEHSVFAPLSGQVLEVNEEALAEPAAVAPETWLIRILPNRLEEELPLLLRTQ